MTPLFVSAWLAMPAVAQNAWDPVSDVRPDSMEALVRDLESTDASRRTFAIRELNRVARMSRKAEFGSLDSPRTTDALSNLDFLDEVAVPVCVQHISRDIEVRRCSTLLVRLETVAARPVLQSALERTESGRLKKHLSKAVAALDSAAAEP